MKFHNIAHLPSSDHTESVRLGQKAYLYNGTEVAHFLRLSGRHMKIECTRLTARLLRGGTAAWDRAFERHGEERAGVTSIPFLCSPHQGT